VARRVCLRERDRVRRRVYLPRHAPRAAYRRRADQCHDRDRRHHQRKHRASAVPVPRRRPAERAFEPTLRPYALSRVDLHRRPAEEDAHLLDPLLDAILCGGHDLQPVRPAVERHLPDGDADGKDLPTRLGGRPAARFGHERRHRGHGRRRSGPDDHRAGVADADADQHDAGREHHRKQDLDDRARAVDPPERAELPCIRAFLRRLPRLRGLQHHPDAGPVLRDHHRHFVGRVGAPRAGRGDRRRRPAEPHLRQPERRLLEALTARLGGLERDLRHAGRLNWRNRTLEGWFA
jgi:hypothetical protein